MAQQITQAEYYRAHREAFRLALELKCTPKEAECELRRRQAQAARERLDAKMNAPIVPGLPELATGTGHVPEEPRGEPWMMRE